MGHGAKLMGAEDKIKLSKLAKAPALGSVITLILNLDLFLADIM